MSPKVMWSTVLVAFVALQFVVSEALAWGDEGHEIVGLIAEHYLTPDVRQKVDRLLAHDATRLASHDTGHAIADEATWAAKYRDASGRRLHYIATREWHFVELRTWSRIRVLWPQGIDIQ
jgi:hypothetical protein